MEAVLMEAGNFKKAHPKTSFDLQGLRSCMPYVIFDREVG
jgi:hypothetical protein